MKTTLYIACSSLSSASFPILISSVDFSSSILEHSRPLSPRGSKTDLHYKWALPKPGRPTQSLTKLPIHRAIRRPRAPGSSLIPRRSRVRNVADIGGKKEIVVWDERTGTFITILEVAREVSKFHLLHRAPMSNESELPH